LRVPEYNSRDYAQLLTLIKAFSNQSRANTQFLMARHYCYWGEPHYPETGIARQRNGREKYVSDNDIVLLRNQRNGLRNLAPQSINQISLRIGFECRGVDPTNRVAIRFLFISD
jgi:hypothetical protein